MKKININRLIVLVTVLSIVISSFCGVGAFISASADGDAPTYDSAKHTDLSIKEVLKGSKNDDGSFKYEIDDINYVDYSNMVNTGLVEDAVVYGSAVLPAGVYATNAIWDGQYLVLASATDWNGKYGYLVIKFTQGDNVDIQLVDGGNVNLTYIGGHISTLKPQYPNSSSTFGTEARKATYALSLTNFTLWVDGVKIIDNYAWNSAGKEITIESFAVGTGSVNSKNHISDYRVWTDNESVKEPVPAFVSGNHLDVTKSEEIELTKGADGTYSIVGNTSNYNIIKEHVKTKVTAGAVIYGSAKIAPDNFATATNTVSLIIAKTVQGNVAITFTAANGIELWITDENGNKISSIYKASYNGATDAFGNGIRKITYSVSKKAISVWCGVDKLIDNLEWQNTQPTIEITDFIFGVSAKGDKINVTGYRIWGSTDSVKVVLPVYDPKLHIDISSRSDIDGSMSTDGTYSFTTTSNMYRQIKEFGGVILDDDATIYGAVTLSPSTIYMNQWGGVILPLAKANSWRTGYGTLFVKFTHGDRIDVQHFSDGENEPLYVGALIPTLKPAYPDGTSNFGDKPHDVVYMINKQSFTLWVDGVKVIDNYVWNSTAGMEISIESYVLGIEGVNSTVNAQGYRVWVDKSEGKVTAPVYDKNKHYDITAGVSLNGEREEDGSLTFKSTNDNFDSTLKLTSDNVSDLATLYGSVKLSDINWKNNGLLYINLGKAACGDISGDLQLSLTQNNGAYVRIKNGDKVYNLGDTIPSANISYPNGGTFPSEGAAISYELNGECLSVWIGDAQILSDFKLEEAVDSTGNPNGIYLSSFGVGVGSENASFTASGYRVWSEILYTPTPAFDSKNDINMLSAMEAVKIGEGPVLNNENGKLTLGSSEFGDGDGKNSGVMYAGPILREGGTMYLRTVITTDTEYDPSLMNAQTYGGPVIRLANARAYRQDRTGGFSSGDGYFDILFTRGDSIDFRIRTDTGYDLFYIGANIPDFKIVYPDTYNGSRGDSEYEVTIAISNRYISMWINGKALLLDHSLFDLKGTGNDSEFAMDIWDIAPGILYNLSKGTAEEFSVWCSKEDFAPFELGEITYPTVEPTEAFATEAELKAEKASENSKNVSSVTKATVSTAAAATKGMISREINTEKVSNGVQLALVIICVVAAVGFVLLFATKKKLFVRRKMKRGDYR